MKVIMISSGILDKWSKKWQIEFNSVKCNVLQFWRPNQGRIFTVNGRCLGSMLEQRNQDVQVQNSPKITTQVDMVKEPFGMLHVLVRQHLEYCVHV